MRRSIVLAMLLGVALAVPIHASAQVTTPDSTVVDAVRRKLRSDLRNFVTAQERYYATNSTYARTLAEMNAMYVPSRGVLFVVLTASNRGHNEIALDPAVPGLVCSMFVGNAPPPFGTGTEGNPECRGP